MTDYRLEQLETILKNDSSTGNFTFTESGKSFTNNGTIGIGGDAPDPVGNLNMSGIGSFINNGEATFSGTLSLSAAGLNNTGILNGNDIGGISSLGDIINNTGGTLTGSISTSTKISNDGEITGLSADSELDATGGSIINSKTISGYGLVTSSILTNNEGAFLETNTIQTASFTNRGIVDAAIIESDTLENINGADSIGTISNAASMTVKDSLINSGKIENVITINAENGLTNTGIISGSDLINVTGTVIREEDKLLNSGTLQDIKRITGNLALENAGQIKMTGNFYETEITGKLTLVNGTFGVRVAPLGSVNENDKYLADGNVTISGGTVKVSDIAGSTGTYHLGDKWTFLESPETLNVIEGLSVVQDPNMNLSPILKFKTSYDDSNYYLYLERAKNYEAGAQTYNQEQLGRYLDQTGTHCVPGSDLEDVLAKLDALSPGEGISSNGRLAMAQLDGAVYGSMLTMGIQNHTIVNNQIASVLRPGTCCSNCTASPETNFWGNWYGIDGYNKSDGNTFRGDYRTCGVIVGGDRNLNSDFRIGGFFAYGNTEYYVNTLLDQANADSYKAGLYFVRSKESGYFLGNINFGWDDYSVDRNIRFLNRVNNGETSGREFAIRLEKGFHYSVRNFLFQPFAAMQYIYLDTDAFQENGIGTTALNIGAADYNSWRTELGARVVLNCMETSEYKGNIYLQSSWLHEFSDTCGSVSGSFRNDRSGNYSGTYSYTVNGNDLGTDWFNIGLGANCTRNQLTLFGECDFLVNNAQNFLYGNIGLAYKF
ncbi:MAG: autotransporter domain-containing protein [Planctomycetia bacterium]|nr:autotransporter domain-containing protein [Planctomycetia bacterium]